MRERTCKAGVVCPVDGCEIPLSAADIRATVDEALHEKYVSSSLEELFSGTGNRCGFLHFTCFFCNL